jgi:hypothetical protein
MRSATALALLFCIAHGVGAEDINLAEFHVSAAVPDSDDWSVLRNGPIEGVEGTHFFAIADQAKRKQLTLLVMPLPKDAQTLDAMKQGWEDGFLKKASRKISTADIMVDGIRARRVLAGLKSPEGVEFQVLGILVVANGKNYTIGAVSSEPIDSDADIKKFLESVRIQKKRD